MSTTKATMAYLPTLSTATPTLVALLGLTGLGGGLYTFLQPTSAPHLFGIVPPTTMLPAANTRPNPHQAALIAYIRVHGIRNLATGLGIVGLSLYALFGTDSPETAGTVMKCLGVMLLSGVPVALGDGWLIAEYVKAVEDGKGELDVKDAKAAVGVGREKSLGHTLTSLLIAAVGAGCLFS